MGKIGTALGKTFLAGILAILPLVLTVVIVVWAGKTIFQYAGPGSAVGEVLSSIGLAFATTNQGAAYILGFLVILALIFSLGLLVRAHLHGRLKSLASSVIKRVPLVGSIYDLSDRFIGMFDQEEKSDLKAMSPVWVFFGGEGGTAVLSLMPNADTIDIAGHKYHVVLVPSAPIPVGGGLLYVPADWVKPAAFGVETLTSIYVTMGATKPPEK